MDTRIFFCEIEFCSKTHRTVIGIKENDKKTTLNMQKIIIIINETRKLNAFINVCEWESLFVFVCVYLWVVILRYIVSPTFSLVKSFKYLLQDKNYYSIYALCVHYNSKYLDFLCMDCCVYVPMLLPFQSMFVLFVVVIVILRSSQELKRCCCLYSASILLFVCVSVIWLFFYI